MPEGLHVDLVTHLWNFGESIISLGGPLNTLSDPLTNLGMGQAPLFGNFETASYFKAPLMCRMNFVQISSISSTALPQGCVSRFFY